MAWLPMPGAPGEALLKGLGTGTDMFRAIMQPRIAREKMAQQAKQHAENLGLRKQQQARLQRQFEQDLREKTMLQNLFGNIMQGGQPSEQQFVTGDAPPPQSYIAPMPQVQQPSMIPSAQFGDQSMIAPMPQVTQPQGQPPQDVGPTTLPVVPDMRQQQDPWENLRQSPFIRAMAKKHYGIDIGADTPQERTQRQLDLHKAERLFDVDHPTASSGSITSYDRAAQRQLQLDKLNEQIRHNKQLEAQANPDAKVDLARRRADLEAQKQATIAEQKANQQIRVADSKTDMEYKKTLNKEQAKQFSEMEKEAGNVIRQDPNYTELKDIVSSPTFESIRKHPVFGKLEFEAIRRGRGTKEQQELVGRFDTTTKQLVADMAKGLNSRFTNKDLALAESMKISDKDNFNSAKAKAELLTYMHEIGQQRLNMAMDFARDRKMSPTQALQLADEKLDGDAIRAKIRKSLQGKAETGEVIVVNPQGKRFKTTAANAANLPEGWTRG